MMLPEIKRGSTRTVFLTDQYVLKVPSHHRILGGFKKIRSRFLVERNIREAIFDLLLSEQIDESDWNADLFGGFYANRIESMFDWSLGDLVEPTIASFAGGLVNIQRRNADIVAPKRYVGDRVDDVVPGTWQIGVNHVFSDNANFGLSGGKLKLRDYGAVGMVEFLLFNRRAIKKVFDELSEEFVQK